jgi:hypothetical protein
MLLVLVLLTMTMGNAQQNYGVEVSVSSGFVIPSSPMTFANYWRMQYGGGIGGGYALSQSITLLGSFEYYRFRLNEDGVNKGFDTKYMSDIWIFDRVSLNPSADPSSVIALSANVRVAPSTLSARLSPYFIAGIGVMHFSQSDIALPVTSVLSINSAEIAMTADTKIVGGNETAGFVQGGMGIDFKVAESFNIFIEARCAIGLTKGQSTTYIPLMLGVKMQL